MNKISFLKVYFSPFKPIIPYLHIGKIKVGTPIFYPRRWIKNKEKKGYYICVDKTIGFDFVGLGWKTKWEDSDIRHEWDPVWSFVFFKWQIAFVFTGLNHHYWECWLAYETLTDKKKSKLERVKEAREKFPCTWISYKDGEKTTICYWNYILKNKYKNF